MAPHTVLLFSLANAPMVNDVQGLPFTYVRQACVEQCGEVFAVNLSESTLELKETLSTICSKSLGCLFSTSV